MGQTLASFAEKLIVLLELCLEHELVFGDEPDSLGIINLDLGSTSVAESLPTLTCSQPYPRNHSLQDKQSSTAIDNVIGDQEKNTRF